ncbi:hypothetical protein CLV42_102330 [Chitinophaga ginsengisoli]|uniref:Uncharacterized protein n=1 Tax=Chitinophaga ginsengisoli TaxID=363837 RepID=A0A2P8GLA6_9BACT|nr:hypothetical protein CLV42_102330 [Chitinophaga ginsengisoli]
MVAITDIGCFETIPQSGDRHVNTLKRIGLDYFVYFSGSL